MPQEHNYYFITDADEIIIDEKFKRILPLRTEAELISLENSILKYGCIEPLILWNNILLDGHNRLEILKKNELPVKTVSLKLGSREEAIVYLIDFQITRRNLTPIQLSYYRGLHYNTEKQIQGSNQYTVKSAEAQSGPRQTRQSTAERLADHYNVSRNTIKRDAQVATAIDVIGETSSDIKIDILSGKTHITRKQLKEMSSGTADDISAVIAEIEEGSFISRRPGISSGANDDYAEVDSGNMQPWEKEFGKMTDEFRQVLRSHAKTEDTASVRNALRSYITMLENLYNQI